MIPWINFRVGTHRITCPACGRGERDKSAGLTVDTDGKGVVHCHRCHFIETYRPKRGVRLHADARPANKPVEVQKYSSLSDYGRDMWMACKPLAGIALGYLERRRCCIPPADGDLRYHPSLKHPNGHVGPALVGLITDAVTGRQLSLHRTWIQADGRKADIEVPRMVLGGHPKRGGVIRLWPDEAVTMGLGVAEGIETALSLAWAYAPVWACIDAGNLAVFPVLPGIECLVIAKDNDPAGIAGADACAQCWAGTGAEVFVTRQEQNDLNDVVAGVLA